MSAREDEMVLVLEHVRRCTAGNGSALAAWLEGGERPHGLSATGAVSGPLVLSIRHETKGLTFYRQTDAERAREAAWVAYWQATTGWWGSAGSSDAERAAAPPPPADGDGEWVFVSWADVRAALLPPVPVAQPELFAC